MVVFLPKLAEKSLFLLFLLLLFGRALSMTFAVTANGGKQLYSGVPDSRDFYDSPSEDEGTAPGAYSTTDLSSDDDTAPRDSLNDQCCQVLPTRGDSSGTQCSSSYTIEESSSFSNMRSDYNRPSLGRDCRL